MRFWTTSGVPTSPDYVAESNVVDRHIRNLRIKLRNGLRRAHDIETVHGRGYCFMQPDDNTNPGGAGNGPSVAQWRWEVQLRSAGAFSLGWELRQGEEYLPRPPSA